jgi:hypothetical protein
MVFAQTPEGTPKTRLRGHCLLNRVSLGADLSLGRETIACGSVGKEVVPKGSQPMVAPTRVSET